MGNIRLAANSPQNKSIPLYSGKIASDIVYPNTVCPEIKPTALYVKALYYTLTGQTIAELL